MFRVCVCLGAFSLVSVCECVCVFACVSFSMFFWVCRCLFFLADFCIFVCVSIYVLIVLSCRASVVDKIGMRPMYNARSALHK